MKTTLRWIALLPAAIGSFVAAHLAFAFVLWFGSRFGDSTNFQPGEFMYTLSQDLVGGGISGWAYVQVGAAVAPSHKRNAALVLFIVLVFLLGAGMFVTAFSQKWGSMTACIAVAAGATLALLDVWKDLSLQERS